MRGALVGSFVLIVTYVLLEAGNADKVAAGGNVVVAGLRRLLSGDVAGIPQRKGLANTGATVGQAVGSAAAAGAQAANGRSK